MNLRIHSPALGLCWSICLIERVTIILPYGDFRKCNEIKHIFMQHLKHVKHWPIHQRHRIEYVFKCLQFNGKANKSKWWVLGHSRNKELLQFIKEYLAKGEGCWELKEGFSKEAAPKQSFKSWVGVSQWRKWEGHFSLRTEYEMVRKIHVFCVLAWGMFCEDVGQVYLRCGGPWRLWVWTWS